MFNLNPFKKIEQIPETKSPAEMVREEADRLARENHIEASVIRLDETEINELDKEFDVRDLMKNENYRKGLCEDLLYYASADLGDQKKYSQVILAIDKLGGVPPAHELTAAYRMLKTGELDRFYTPEDALEFAREYRRLGTIREKIASEPPLVYDSAKHEE